MLGGAHLCWTRGGEFAWGRLWAGAGWVLGCQGDGPAWGEPGEPFTPAALLSTSHPGKEALPLAERTLRPREGREPAGGLAHLLSSSRRSPWPCCACSRRLSRSSAFAASSLCFSVSQASSCPLSRSTSISRAFFSLGAGVRVWAPDVHGGGEPQDPHWAHLSPQSARRVGRAGGRRRGCQAAAPGSVGRDEEGPAPSGPRPACEAGGHQQACPPPGGPVGAPEACRPRLPMCLHAEPSATHRPSPASPCRTCWKKGTPPQLHICTCLDRALDPPDPAPL